MVAYVDSAVRATQLAQWFGLPTFDIAIIEVCEADEIPFVDQKGKRIGQAQPGPAFISRGEAGEPWSGNESQLKRLVNPKDISRLVVFDTWTRNCDRHWWPDGAAMGRARINLNNVFLSEEAPPGQFILKALEHTHCFTCGRALTTKLLCHLLVDEIAEDGIPDVYESLREFCDYYNASEAAQGSVNELWERDAVRGAQLTRPSFTVEAE